MNLAVMAWRNVWRNSRRSLITISAMSLALGVELIYSGLIAGMLDGMVEDVTEMDLGHIQVFAPGWEDRPSLHEAVKDDEAVVRRIEEAGYAATARLYGGGLAASGELSAGVSFIGLDPERDRRVLTVDQALADGAWLDPGDPKGVVVGRGLARTLALKPGAELVVLSQAADGSMANELYHVRGVLLSVGAGTDRSAILMTDGAFRELMAFPEGAHRVIVRTPPDADLAAATAQIASLVPEARVKNWKQLNPFIAQMLDAVQVQVKVVYFVVYVAVAILVLNAMLMAIFERIREFGVLKAIGYGPSQVVALMVMEGLFQAAVAAVIGTLGALPFMAYLQVYGLDLGPLGGTAMMGMTMPTIWYGSYSAGGLLTPVVMLFGIVGAAVAYPAVKAAWISPVDAIHHS